MKTQRKYNWKPDLPDQRDFSFSLKVAPPVRLPTHIDLREKCSEVEDQGHIGSCTGNALAGLIEYLELQEMNQSFEDVSRLFIYYNERILENTTNEDSGASLRDGIKALTNWGVCREILWLYSQKNVLKKPSSKAYLEAKQHRISTYFRLETLHELKQCLGLGFPFVFGFAVYESFETIKVARTGIMPMPKNSERMLGGHAVMAVGYDDDKERVLVRNSWGKDWGEKGYFWMPYAYIESRNLSDDFWTIRK